MNPYEQALHQPRIKREPYGYTERIKKQSVRDAVLQVSKLTMHEIKLADTVFRKKYRDILICMLWERCKMTQREIGYIAGLNHGMVSEIVNEEKDNFHKTSKQEVFETYCELMCERVRVCQWGKNRITYTFANDFPNNFQLKSIIGN